MFNKKNEKCECEAEIESSRNNDISSITIQA